MGQAHDHDAVHSTKDGTVVMQATVLTRPKWSTQLQCTGYTNSVLWGISCPLGPTI
jgi:hypothetical protein